MLLARRDGVGSERGQGLATTSPTGAERIVMPAATTAETTKAFNTSPFFGSTFRHGFAGKSFKPQRRGLAGHRGAG
jgi:hypothetical protein